MDTIDLTGDSDVEYSWPNNRPVRRRKQINRYVADDVTRRKKRKKRKKMQQTERKCKSMYVGCRIAKYFGSTLYLGTVEFADEYYHIVYEDGDEEDIDACDLRCLLELYQKEEKRSKTTFTPAQTTQPSYSSVCVTPIQQKDSFRKASSDSPTLFKIHDISPSQIDTVSNFLPPEHKKNADLVVQFFLLCYERQLIWQKKRAGLKELTKVPKMAKSFFCNVYRELDRGTQYFRAHLIKHRSRVYGSFNLEEALWDSLCYRLVNKIETFEQYGRIPCRQKYEDFVHGTFLPLWNSNKVVFTSAHQNMGKDRYLATMNSLWKQDGALVKKLAARISSAGDLESCFKVLLRVNNVGKFLAWQVLCDLLEAKVIPFSEDDWVELGPGAKNGIKAIFGQSVSQTCEFVQKTELLRTIQHQVYEAIGISFPRFIGRDITMKNIEHALCEFCKYRDKHVMRKFRGSGSLLDAASACQVCDERYYRTRSKLCDLCRTAYCLNCCDEYGKDYKGAWLCSACIEIDNNE